MSKTLPMARLLNTALEQWREAARQKLDELVAHCERWNLAIDLERDGEALLKKLFEDCEYCGFNPVQAGPGLVPLNGWDLRDGRARAFTPENVASACACCSGAKAGRSKAQFLGHCEEVPAAEVVEEWVAGRGEIPPDEFDESIAELTKSLSCTICGAVNGEGSLSRLDPSMPCQPPNGLGFPICSKCNELKGPLSPYAVMSHAWRVCANQAQELDPAGRWEETLPALQATMLSACDNLTAMMGELVAMMEEHKSKGGL